MAALYLVSLLAQHCVRSAKILVFVSHVYCVSFFADTFIQKTKKSYTDTRARRNMSNINTELQDVQRIMVQNIDDVMQRGVALSGNSN